MKKAFTLAEVLITLAIIGVVAAISIPSVVANTQQKEFQTGLRKAVSVLNSAITMNMALDGESPYETNDLYRYLQRHMSIMKSMVVTPMAADANMSNFSFYTTDGMRFDFPDNDALLPALYENNTITTRGSFTGWGDVNNKTGEFTYYSSICDKDKKANLNGQPYSCSRCGSYGLTNNPDNTVSSPCYILVDVNGDRKPFPKNASCFNGTCRATNIRKMGDPDGRRLTDMFPIMITDRQAIPYGAAAQKAMYEAQKLKNK